MIKEDMKMIGVTGEDVNSRAKWREKIGCGDPRWEKPNVKKV